MRAPSRYSLLGRSCSALLVCCATLASIIGAAADELRLGVAAIPSAIDPEQIASISEINLYRHVFEPLTELDANQSAVPALATSWRQSEPSTWEFQLRPGVVWHDGTPLTVDDVLASLVASVDAPSSPLRHRPNLIGAAISAPSADLVRVTTPTPRPRLPEELASIVIRQRNAIEAARKPQPSKAAAPPSAIGTGRYRLSNFVSADSAVLLPFPAYWGAKPAWDKVTLKAFKVASERLQALLENTADAIEDVPTADIARLKSNPAVAIVQTRARRVMFLQMDQWRETSPHVNGRDGSAIKNPFRDVRVRRAIAAAINREALIARFFDGNGEVAAQLLPEGCYGVSSTIKSTSYNPDRARKLLAEAGFPSGFKVTLHTPAGRYHSDLKIAESIGQMLGRVGIEVIIESMPPTSFFARASAGADGQPEFSLWLAGWGPGSADNAAPLTALVATHDKDKKRGLSNRGRYSNRAVDEAIDIAATTADRVESTAALARATELAIADVALVPLLHPLNTWASRRDLSLTPDNGDSLTAMMIRRDTPTR